MAGKLVRVEGSTFSELSRVAARLQHRLGRPVSLNEALGYLIAKSQSRTPAFIRLLRQR